MVVVFVTEIVNVWDVKKQKWLNSNDECLLTYFSYYTTNSITSIIKQFNNKLMNIKFGNTIKLQKKSCHNCDRNVEHITYLLYSLLSKNPLTEVGQQ
jgi:hypothetical protein